MCGIVGLFLKTDKHVSRLGALTANMLSTMSERGPDSAGFAVYGGETVGLKLTLRGKSAARLLIVLQAAEIALNRSLPGVYRDTHVVVTLAKEDQTLVRDWIANHAPDLDIVGIGHRMEIYKDVGAPADVAERFGLADMSGTHAIGHTRMATESSVTTDGAHPFSTGDDQCLVHNGSLSNHNRFRRLLEGKGLRFATQNDTEVAAGYLTWRMREGDSLEHALQASLQDLDGFYTFVVGTETGFAVLRDPVACKPAVMAETDDYVAFGSEYRALVGLPGIESARVFEPEPATVYSWTR